MRCGIVLQQEYHKRYGATNGVVDRHTYFGPLKKKHGILVSPHPPLHTILHLQVPSDGPPPRFPCRLQTVAGNVRLCDIQPGDGFDESEGEGEGGVNLNNGALEDEAQAAVQEQREEEQRAGKEGKYAFGSGSTWVCCLTLRCSCSPCPLPIRSFIHGKPIHSRQAGRKGGS